MSPRQSHGSVAHGAPPGVRVIDNVWVPLPDGVRVAVRVWLPEDALQRPVSAVLDAVPYRKADGTAVGDGAWGTYFATHGLAFVRVDLRGSGDSDGLIADEYTDQEQRDVEYVIEWIAGQSWCTGAVGMIGVSWGGFAALQAAARAPEQLRGVIAIYASDDRYSDDVHYIGGCVSALDMTQWATSMMAYINQPPDPAVAEDWRTAWRERLDGAEPWVAHWLAHQRRDDYWRQGSACESYAAIRCPVFAVGGWSDGYRDMVLRVLEHVSAPARGLIGPWGHASPERGAPGPAIGFLQECVRFFACTLDGEENGFFDGPRLISYVQEPVAPAGGYDHRAGRWVADPAWPSPAVTGVRFALAGDRLAQGGEPAAEGTRSLRGLQATGIDGGVWCGDGSPADFGLDQRPDDGASLCWDSAPLGERLDVLGRCEATLAVSVDRPVALVAVRVCDVAPDGASTLVARGILNLSRREGHDRTVPMPVGERVTVRISMQSIGYAVPAGHRLRLAVSPTYWPLAWPSPEPVTLTVHEGQLCVPRRDAGNLDAPPEPFGEPETGTAPESATTLRSPTGRSVRRDLATGESELEFRWQDSRTLLIATATEMGERNVATYRIVEGDPLSATVTCEVETTLHRPGVLDTRTVARTVMTCDRERFTVTSSLDAFDDEVRIHARTYTHHFDRDGV